MSAGLGTTLKYLGITITSSLDRPKTVARRARTALNTSHAICRFIRNYNIPWPITKHIYHTVIAPIMTFGLKTTALTEANKRSMAQIEATMINSLHQASTNNIGEGAGKGCYKTRQSGKW